MPSSQVMKLDGMIRINHWQKLSESKLKDDEGATAPSSSFNLLSFYSFLPLIGLSESIGRGTGREPIDMLW
jgi:hypothetical protein